MKRNALRVLVVLILVVLTVLNPILVLKPLDSTLGRFDDDAGALAYIADFNTNTTIIPYENRRQFYGNLTQSKYLHINESAPGIDQGKPCFTEYEILIDYRQIIYDVISIYFHGSKYRDDLTLSA